MGNINDVVEINITRQTKTVSRQGFGTPLIIGSNCDFVERVRAYSNMDGIKNDFATTDFEYKMAQKIFDQTIHPKQIKIGRCGVPVKMKLNVKISIVANNASYTIKLGDTSFTIDSGASATGASIATALTTAINAGTEPVTATASTDNLNLEADSAGIDFTFSVTKNLSVKSLHTYSEDLVTAFNAIRSEDDDFYFLLLSNRTKSEIVKASESIESTTKIFIACTCDTDVKQVGTEDVASVLKSFNYDRTHLVYTEHPEGCVDAAWNSVMAPKTPGQATWKFKSLKGPVAEKLTDTTELNRILAKNCNLYDTISGSNLTREGVVVSGEFTDIIHGTDWITVNVQADVYDALINQDKIPFTKAGVDVIRNKIAAVLKKAITNGILKDDPAPEVNVPEISDISTSDKATRFLDNIGFTGFYQGAIHKIKISGNLSV